MVNFGYPYNDLVICKDSTDYLPPPPEKISFPPPPINISILPKFLNSPEKYQPLQKQFKLLPKIFTLPPKKKKLPPPLPP